MTTGNAKATVDARCAGWRPIEYAVKGTPAEGHGDTPKTIMQVRAHNRVGQLKKCPKFQ